MINIFFLFEILLVFFFSCSIYSNDMKDNSTIFYFDQKFNENANLQSSQIYKEAKENPILFWEKQAHCLDWFKPWDCVLKWNCPDAKWFNGGKLNACYNCLDRHMQSETRNKIAIFWEGERGEKRSLTYEDLLVEVKKFSNVLKSLGVKKGDRVAIYLPMIPEAIIAPLSCARIGAIHTVIFGGFSSESLANRINDAQAKILITADGGFRRGNIIPLKETADIAVNQCPSIQNTVVINHSKHLVDMKNGRDHWYHTLMNEASPDCNPEEMDAEDTLFILYTSGTTGKPKGIIHTTGGYMVGTTMTTRWVFDIKPSDIYWCTADIGWITGHSYIIYGPLSNGMTQLIYEGAFDWPERNRVWQLIEDYKVTTLYTAPTAIRTFMKWGENWINQNDLSSLRLLGSVGEPINPEAWMWYYTHIGQKKCPIVDTWWQTETGSIMIAPIPGLIPLKPGSATFPLPGINISVFNESGSSCSSGALAITSPWPSMLRGIYQDRERYEKTYWIGNNYLTGDGAKQDEDGYFWLTGRIDDIIKVSGHRLSTAEIESALIDFKGVAEAAVIGIFDSIKGQAIVGFVVLKENYTTETNIEDILKQHVVQKISAIARPERIIIIHDLPKTRSGKIMRRLLRDIAEGRVLGDTMTLSDPGVLDEIKIKYDED